MYDKDMRPDYHEYDKVPPHGRPENGPACPHDTYGNPQCPPHDFYGFHGTLGPGYHLLPVPPNTWGLTTEQQLLALGGKVDELIRTFNEYDRKIYGAWDAVVNSALSNDAYYKDITVEDGYIGDTGAKYKVVHIPYTDKAGQPIYLELGVPYNNTTNAGLTEECFDASERTLADKLVPAVNAGTGFTGLAMFKHAPIEGTPMPMSMPAPGSSGWTLGITENGYLKLYDTANSTYDNLKWDNVRNAMGVVGLLVNNKEKATNYYADNKGDTLARVGVGMNYDTKERFIVVVQGDDTHGTTSDLLADIFVRYNCNVAVETANSGSAFGMDKGEMMFMPPTTTITLGIDGAPNVPHTGAFWYITKRRHYHNEYVKDVATLMQRLGRHVWSAKIYSKSIDDVEASVKDLGLKLNEEAKAREEKDNDIQRQIDEEILGREGGDTEVEDKLNAAIPKLEKQIQDAVAQLNQQISEEAEKRENADVKEIQTTLDGNKRTYTLVLKDESTIEVPVETYDYTKLTQRLTDIFNFEEEFRDFYSKYSAWKQTIDETYDSMETLLNSTVQRVGQNETDISTLKTTANQLREQMTALDQTVASFQAQIVQMELSVEDLKQAWTKYHTAWSQFITEYNTWKSETDTKVQNHESRIATLEREYAEQESRITVVEQTVQTQHEHLQRVDTKDAEQDATLASHTQQISDIQQKDSEQDKQIADLQTADLSHEARMEFLQTADEKLDARVKQTETDVAGVSGRVSANEQAIQSHDGVLAGIADAIDDINKTDADLQKQITEIDNKETANAESIGRLSQTVTNNRIAQEAVNQSVEGRLNTVEEKVVDLPENFAKQVNDLSDKVDTVVQSNEEIGGRMDALTEQELSQDEKIQKLEESDAQQTEQLKGLTGEYVSKAGDTMTGALATPQIDTAVIGNNVAGKPVVIEVKNTAEPTGYVPAKLPKNEYSDGKITFTDTINYTNFATADTAKIDIQIRDWDDWTIYNLDGLTFTVTLCNGEDDTAMESSELATSLFKGGKTLKIFDRTEEPLTVSEITWKYTNKVETSAAFDIILVEISGSNEDLPNLAENIINSGTIESIEINAYLEGKPVRLAGADAVEDNEYVTYGQLKDEGASIEADAYAYCDSNFVKLEGDELDEDAVITIPGHKDYDSNEALTIAPREIKMKKDADPHSVAGREIKETVLDLNGVVGASLRTNVPNGLVTKEVINIGDKSADFVPDLGVAYMTPDKIIFRDTQDAHHLGFDHQDAALGTASRCVRVIEQTGTRTSLANIQVADVDDNSDANFAATKAYANARVKKGGDVMSGPLHVTGQDSDIEINQHGQINFVKSMGSSAKAYRGIYQNNNGDLEVKSGSSGESFGALAVANATNENQAVNLRQLSSSIINFPNTFGVLGVCKYDNDTKLLELTKAVNLETTTVLGAIVLLYKDTGIITISVGDSNGSELGARLYGQGISLYFGPMSDYKVHVHATGIQLDLSNVSQQIFTTTEEFQCSGLMFCHNVNLPAIPSLRE